jgi:prepilin-type N-terminal cleavage/methylation domain-containing protein
MRRRGFTLIELLTVIGIMAIVYSIVLPSISASRLKADDDKRIADMEKMQLAVSLYYQQYHKLPDNFNCAQAGPGGAHELCVPGTASTKPGYFVYAACDNPLPEAAGGNDTMLYPAAYNASMQELVDAGFLQSIPHSPRAPGYCYNAPGQFGPEAANAAIVTTELLSRPASLTGEPPSVRPYTGNTWCTHDTVTHEYCFLVDH